MLRLYDTANVDFILVRDPFLLKSYHKTVYYLNFLISFTILLISVLVSIHSPFYTVYMRGSRNF